MERIEKHISYLQDLVRDLSDYQARNGKNKAIRNKESSKISSAANTLERYLERNQDLSELLFEYHGGNEFGYNETITPQYVVRDTERFIEFLKDKLSQGEGTGNKESTE